MTPTFRKHVIAADPSVNNAVIRNGQVLEGYDFDERTNVAVGADGHVITDAKVIRDKRALEEFYAQAGLYCTVEQLGSFPYEPIAAMNRRTQTFDMGVSKVKSCLNPEQSDVAQTGGTITVLVGNGSSVHVQTCLRRIREYVERVNEARLDSNVLVMVRQDFSNSTVQEFLELANDKHPNLRVVPYYDEAELVYFHYSYFRERERVTGVRDNPGFFGSLDTVNLAKLVAELRTDGETTRTAIHVSIAGNCVTRIGIYSSILDEFETNRFVVKHAKSIELGTMTVCMGEFISVANDLTMAAATEFCGTIMKKYPGLVAVPYFGVANRMVAPTTISRGRTELSVLVTGSPPVPEREKAILDLFPKHGATVLESTNDPQYHARHFTGTIQIVGDVTSLTKEAIAAMAQEIEAIPGFPSKPKITIRKLTLPKKAVVG